MGWLRARYPHDISRVLLLRIAGARAVDGRVAYDIVNILGLLVTLIGLCCWCVLEAVTSPADESPFTKFLPWCAYFLTVGASLFYLCHRLTQAFLHITVSLDRCMTEYGQRDYHRWSRYALSPWLQGAAGLILAAGAPIALVVVQRVVGAASPIVVLPPSYFVLGVTGFLVGATAYWAVAGMVLVRRLTRPRRLRLYPLNPARTPGVEELAQVMLTAFAVAGIYSVLLLFPLFYWTSGVDDALPPGLMEPIRIVKLLLIGLCGLATLGVGIVPQFHISSAIRAVRRTTMLRLLRRIEEDPKVWRGLNSSPLTEILSKVSEAPASTLGSAHVVQITVGVAAAILPTVIGLVNL